jgi:hypothetical protein
MSPGPIVTRELERLYAILDTAREILWGAGLSQGNVEGVIGASIWCRHVKRRYIVWAQHGEAAAI